MPWSRRRFLPPMSSGPCASILKRTAILFLPALVLFYALVPLVYYGVLDAESVAFDRGLRSRRHHPLQRGKSVPGRMERRSDGVADQQVLRPGPLGLLLAHGALPVRDAAARASRRRDLRHAATGRGMAACARGAPPHLSEPPRDLHVAVPRPLEPRSAGLGLARSGLGLWPQSIFHAARCAP